ncbi:hypothetical protein [Rummeliibacillus pycnus]|uniref:hypothetical protein n=1 Tax=Rummeliibacillus pycnus TaxID=101070 RepID=UPI0037CBCF3C
MKKYFLQATYSESRNTIKLQSKKDFRKCKEIEVNGRRLLVVTPDRFVDLTGATVVLMGKKNKSYD